MELIEGQGSEGEATDKGAKDDKSGVESTEPFENKKPSKFELLPPFEIHGAG